VKELLKSDSQSYALMGKGPFFDSQCIYAVSVSCIMSITTQNALKVHVTQLVFIYFYHTKHNTKGFESYTSNLDCEILTIGCAFYAALPLQKTSPGFKKLRHEIRHDWQRDIFKLGGNITFTKYYIHRRHALIKGEMPKSQNVTSINTKRAMTYTNASRIRPSNLVK